MSKRLERAAEVIKREVSSFIIKNFDVGAAIVTIIRVEVSEDLHYARIYFLVIPDNKSGYIKKMFDQNIFEIQSALNKRLRMRPVPRIKFFIDNEELEAAKIEQVLGAISQ